MSAARRFGKRVAPVSKARRGWLGFLRANGFGGILADEMGLGKTLQALAFLNSLRTANVHPPSSILHPHLIVCPTSLVFNWVAEAKKFTPELEVLALHGPDRHKLFDQIATSDIVVTAMP